MRTRRRVLVVNDDQRMTETTQSLLVAEGYDARGALDGESALAVLDEWPADVIILDLRMPRLDGWAFLELQLERGGAPRYSAPIVVWSAADRDGLERARQLGAAECLPAQSTSPDLLLATIERLLINAPEID
ncbi:MAG: response regulator [Mycobacterium sp.]|nr:response regulator [Mycobacterium sp.]